MVTRKIRFGIIGCGIISRIHQEQLQSIEEAELVAVADENEEKAKELGKAAKADWYTDYRQLLKRADIDVVNILTPSGKHAEIAIEAAKAQKHIICEKPIDTTIEKAIKMIQECEKQHVKLSVISQHRFDPSTIKVKEAINEGKLGSLFMGHASISWYRTQSYYDSGNWRGTWELDGGGVLMNQGIHTIDLLQHLMGPIESVYALTSTFAHHRIEVEDTAVAAVKFKNGGLGTISGTTSAYPGLSARLEVFGTNGSAVIADDILTAFYLKGAYESEEHYGSKAINLAETKPFKQTSGARDPAAIQGKAHGLQIQDMIFAIREKREPLVNGYEGIKPLTIILAIYESAEKGVPVLLDNVKSKITWQDPA